MAINYYERVVGGLDFDFTVGTNAITVATVTAGGTGYLVGDTITAADITSEAVVDTGVLPTDFVLTVATVSGTAIATFTITNGGTDGTDGDGTASVETGTETGVPSADYIDHDLYELGGVINEYATDYNNDLDDQSSYTPADPTNTPLAGTDNDPRLTVARKADQPQLEVQKKYIDGGTIEVFAEPTIVDRNGNVVGNVVRTEDCRDEERCVAIGGTWTVNAGGYGYCENADFTTAFDADKGRLECIEGGHLWDAVLNACVDADGTDDTVLEAYLNGGAGDAYADVRKKEICEDHGHFWTGTACDAFGDVDFAGQGTQALCEGVGGIWIAGTCYSPEDFGNAHGGDYGEKVGSHNDYDAD